MKMEATKNEIMTCTAARKIKNGENVIVGIGLPLIAALLAKNIHAPDAVLMIELGVVDLKLDEVHGPGFFGLEITPNTSMISNITDVLGVFLQGGWVNLGFLGAAQADKYGNLNTTVIGSYDKPTVKLPGSGGSNDIASLADGFYIIMRQGADKLVEKVDFITSPGFLTGAGAREEAGLTGGGPRGMITDMGVYGFDENGEAYLESYHPGCSVEEILKNTGWDLKVSPKVFETEITEAELNMLRALDPRGIYR